MNHSVRMKHPNGASVTTSNIQAQKPLDVRKAKESPTIAGDIHSRVFLHQPELCSLIPLPSLRNLICGDPKTQDQDAHSRVDQEQELVFGWLYSFLPLTRHCSVLKSETKQSETQLNKQNRSPIMQNTTIKTIPIPHQDENELPTIGMGFLPQAVQYTDQNKVRTLWGGNSETCPSLLHDIFTATKPQTQLCYFRSSKTLAVSVPPGLATSLTPSRTSPIETLLKTIPLTNVLVSTDRKASLKKSQNNQ